MALKDWKLKFKTKGQILWINEKKEKLVQITDDYGKGWNYASWGRNEKSKYKHFKTKSQALKLAKSYMRKH
ncbi:MAG: hypothetical protein KKF48_02780 [Nanoarchaeota archaeon]|nr:hypothetical protein [Nanoarchaeota archaeon]MBU1027947.1 hypothetical protein [Nanoarchaeota archaeon]